jgi:hypothetical protein
MEFALKKAGFRISVSPTSSGWSDIIRFKVLKNMGIHQVNWLEKIIPWKWLTPIVDHSMKISAHPLGWKKEVN